MQQILGLSVTANKTFANFNAGRNAALLAMLTDLTEQAPNMHLVGSALGVGVSHLLQATCHHYAMQGLVAYYLPMQQLVETPFMLDGLEQADCLAIDDWVVTETSLEFQRQIFGLYERAMAQSNHVKRCRILWGSQGQLEANPDLMPDLVSRVKLAYHAEVFAASDDSLGQIVLQRAQERGLMLTVKVRDYILQRARRDLVTLLDWIDRLDEAQIRNQQPISFKLVREIIHDAPTKPET